MTISVTAGILDLFSPKFGLDNLGTPGDRMMIRLVLAPTDGRRRMIVHWNHKAQGRHTDLGTPVPKSSLGVTDKSQMKS
jgi:hypothetical protein